MPLHCRYVAVTCVAQELGLDDKNAQDGVDPIESARQVLELNSLADKHMVRAQAHVEGMLRQQKGEDV